MKILYYFLILAMVGLSCRLSRGEPWLGSRFAQNCAACHAPGRVNVAPAQRRCTLSCQGCHTNPNGGGLRNSYGKWTQARWLNSVYVRNFALNKPHPSQSKENFIEPDAGDPWHSRQQSYFNAGIDSRFVYLDDQAIRGLTSTRVQSAFPMANDLAVSVEPFRRLTLVLESRFLNGPNNTAWDRAFESESRVRSAYLMIDDLPYNTYFMYGLYRPLFGNYSPDHEQLAAKITGLHQRATFKSLSVGTAPNVPFLNVHYIQPMNSLNESQDNGYAVNLGARFVTLGAYGMLSYWNTKTNHLTSPKRLMTSFTGGLTYGRYTLVGDLTRIQREIVNKSKDTGDVVTLENRYRIWRESYLKLILETLDTARDLSVGSAYSYKLALNSFIISGLELELSYRKLNETISSLKIDEQATMAQLHFFF